MQASHPCQRKWGDGLLEKSTLLTYNLFQEIRKNKEGKYVAEKIHAQTLLIEQALDAGTLRLTICTVCGKVFSGSGPYCPECQRLV